MVTTTKKIARVHTKEVRRNLNMSQQKFNWTQKSQNAGNEEQKL